MKQNGMGNLRVPRAETWLAVYRSLAIPKQEKKKEQAAPHADTLDHGKHVFKCDCFVKCAWESRMKFKLCVEALESDS